MSDEGIDDAILAELRGALLAARAELESEAATTRENAKPVDLGLSIGRLSRVDALQQQQMALARRGRSDVRAQQIRAALSRIEAGTYGECLKCGEPIAIARLRAAPEAPFCHGCQAARR